MGAAVYAILGGIGRHLARTKLPLGEFFVSSDAPETKSTAGPPESIESRIRAAYWELTPGRGENVSLTDLRGRLSGFSRAEVDQVLRKLNRVPGIAFVPESNQKVLSGAAREAAVNIGDEDKHYMSIAAR